MRTAELCAVTATARAVAFLDDPDASVAQLEPAHPAFVAFRRMPYVWHEGSVLQPVGDSVGLWLRSLREQAVTAVWLADDGGFHCCARRAAAVDEWRPLGSAPDVSLHGAASEPAAAPARAASVSAAAGALRDLVEREAAQSDAVATAPPWAATTSPSASAAAAIPRPAR